MQIKSIYKTYEIVFDKYNDYIDRDDAFFIIDKAINDIYELDIKGNVIYIESTEREKELTNINTIIYEMMKKGIRKSQDIIAIGGGVVQDISGYISSVLFRGVNWEFIPTTLLAQADSCIGSKTSINIKDYKNQIGTFWPPNRIIIDTYFLRSLSDIDIKSGYGEILKYHILDNNLKLINDITDEIKYCLGVKKKYIEEDEFDRNVRNILNYGHCFGHALESASDFIIPHGEAVIIGIDFANRLAYNRRLITSDRFIELCKFIEDYYPQYDLFDIHADELIYYMMKDKKRIGNKMTMILPNGIGISKYNDITEKEVKEIFDEI